MTAGRNGHAGTGVNAVDLAAWAADGYKTGVCGAIPAEAVRGELQTTVGWALDPTRFGVDAVTAAVIGLAAEGDVDALAGGAAISLPARTDEVETDLVNTVVVLTAIEKEVASVGLTAPTGSGSEA